MLSGKFIDRYGIIHLASQTSVHHTWFLIFTSLVLDPKLETVTPLLCTLNRRNAGCLDSGLKAFLILLVGKLKFGKYHGHHIAYDMMPTNLIGRLMRWHVQCCWEHTFYVSSIYLQQDIHAIDTSKLPCELSSTGTSRSGAQFIYNDISGSWLSQPNHSPHY